MKHKLIQLITIILIAAFASQNLALLRHSICRQWCGFAGQAWGHTKGKGVSTGVENGPIPLSPGQNLRPRAARDREYTLDQEARLAARIHHMEEALANNSGILTAGHITAVHDILADAIRDRLPKREIIPLVTPHIIQKDSYMAEALVIQALATAAIAPVYPYPPGYSSMPVEKGLSVELITGEEILNTIYSKYRNDVDGIVGMAQNTAEKTSSDAALDHIKEVLKIEEALGIPRAEIKIMACIIATRLLGLGYQTLACNLLKEYRPDSSFPAAYAVHYHAAMAVMYWEQLAGAVNTIRSQKGKIDQDDYKKIFGYWSETVTHRDQVYLLGTAQIKKVNSLDIKPVFENRRRYVLRNLFKMITATDNGLFLFDRAVIGLALAMEPSGASSMQEKLAIIGNSMISRCQKADATPEGFKHINEAASDLIYIYTALVKNGSEIRPEFGQLIRRLSFSAIMVKIINRGEAPLIPKPLPRGMAEELAKQKSAAEQALENTLRPAAALERGGLIKRGGDFQRTRQIWAGEVPPEEGIRYFRGLRERCERALRGEGAAGLLTYGYISDIHGNWGVWERCMREMEEKGVDVIVVLGDSMDRGPDGPRIVEDIMRRSSAGQRIVYVLGSHEILFIRSMAGTMPAFISWINNGGASTLRGAYIPPGIVDIIISYCEKAMENNKKCKDILARVEEGALVNPEEVGDILSERHFIAGTIKRFMEELVIHNSRLEIICQWLKKNGLLYFIDAYGALAVHNKTPTDEEGMPVLDLRGEKGFAALRGVEGVVPQGLAGDKINPELKILTACLFGEGFADKFKSAGDMQEKLLGNWGVSRIIYGHKELKTFDRPSDTRLIGVHTGGRAWLIIGPVGIYYVENSREFNDGALAGEKFLTQVKEYCEARMEKLERATEWNGIPQRKITSGRALERGLESSVLRPRAMADRLEGEKARGGSGISVSDPGIMPYRGHGNATECTMRTLRRCLYELRARAEVNGMKDDKERKGFEDFLQWFDSQLAAGKPLDKVPPSVKLPIRRLTDKEDDTMIREIFIQYLLGGMLPRVVRLPVQELGRVKGEPFYTYLVFASGVIWAAGTGNKTDIELRIRQAVEEYVIVLEKARACGWDMGQMAGWRDSGNPDAYQFFYEAHVGAWERVAAVYNDEFEYIRNKIPFGGIQVRKARRGEVTSAEIKARRAHNFLLKAQRSVEAVVPRNLRSLLESI